MSTEKEQRPFKERIHKTGLSATTGLGFASGAFVQPFLGGSLSYGIHELSAQTNPDLVKTLALAAIVLTNKYSVELEDKTLQERKFSASSTASWLYLATGRPRVSTAISHFLGFAQLYGINPATWYAAYTGDSNLFIESAAATMITSAAARIAVNTLLLKGGSAKDAIVKRMKNKGSVTPGD